MAYQKTGYQNLLDFDPITGVIKYGAYEVFANQFGVNKQVTKYNYDDYKKSFTGSDIASRINQKPDADMRKQFASDVQNNNLSMNNNIAGFLNGDNGKYLRNSDDGPFTPGKSTKQTADNQFNQVSKIDDNNYEVSSYQIPQDVDFINKIGQAAHGLRITTDKDLLKEQKQTSDAQRQGAATTQLLRDAAVPNIASRTLLN